jgi:hypothetical protein
MDGRIHERSAEDKARHASGFVLKRREDSLGGLNLQHVTFLNLTPT